MKVRFQADADFNQVILAAALRRAPELDFRTAPLAGLHGLDDLQVLALAARDRRVHYGLQGKPVAVPEPRDLAPSREYLDWHGTHVFRG